MTKKRIIKIVTAIVYVSATTTVVFSLLFISSRKLSWNVSADCDPAQRVEADAVNLLQNGYFEGAVNQFPGGGIPQWSAIGSPTLGVTSTYQASGCDALSVSNRSATWESAGIDILPLMELGKTYRLVVWARSDAVASTSLQITLKIQGSAGDQYAFPSIEDINNSGWTKLQGYYKYEYAGTATSAQLYFEQGGGETVDPILYFDEVIVEEVIAGTTYYVSQFGGIPNASGKSQAEAWQAVEDVNSFIFMPGDQLLFQRGIQFNTTEPITLNGSGTFNDPVFVSAYGTGELPILENTNTSGTDGILSLDGNYFRITNLEFTNSTSNNIVEYGIRLDSQNNVVEAVEISGVGYGIQINADNQQITACDIHDLQMIINDADPTDNDFGAIGILVVDSSDIVVNGNQFRNIREPSFDYGTDGAAVEFFRSSTNVNVYGNIILESESLTELGSDNNQDWITNVKFHHNLLINNFSQIGYVHNDTSSNFAVNVDEIYFENNTIYKDTLESGGFFIGFQANPTASSVYLRNNIINVSNLNTWAMNPTGLIREHNLYNLSGATVNYILDPTEFNDDPLFVDGQANDLHLLLTSPAKDTGLDLGYTEDFDGTSIPQGSSPDIGAYEYVSPSLSLVLNSSGSVDLGTSPLGSVVDTSPSGLNQGQNFFVTGGDAKILVSSTIFTGGASSWSFSSSAGEDITRLDYSMDGSAWSTILVPDSQYTLIANQPPNIEFPLYMRLYMPTSLTTLETVTASVTVTAITPD